MTATITAEMGPAETGWEVRVKGPENDDVYRFATQAEAQGGLERALIAGWQLMNEGVVTAITVRGEVERVEL